MKKLNKIDKLRTIVVHSFGMDKQARCYTKDGPCMTFNEWDTLYTRFNNCLRELNAEINMVTTNNKLINLSAEKHLLDIQQAIGEWLKIYDLLLTDVNTDFLKPGNVDMDMIGEAMMDHKELACDRVMLLFYSNLYFVEDGLSDDINVVKGSLEDGIDNQNLRAIFRDINDYDVFLALLFDRKVIGSKQESLIQKQNRGTLIACIDALCGYQFRFKRKYTILEISTMVFESIIRIKPIERPKRDSETYKKEKKAADIFLRKKWIPGK